MTLQIALLLCGLVLLLVIAAISLERHKLQRIDARAKALNDADEPRVPAMRDEATTRIPAQDEKLRTLTPEGPIDSGTRRSTDIATPGAPLINDVEDPDARTEPALSPSVERTPGLHVDSDDLSDQRIPSEVGDLQADVAARSDAPAVGLDDSSETPDAAAKSGTSEPSQKSAAGKEGAGKEGAGKEGKAAKSRGRWTNFRRRRAQDRNENRNQNSDMDESLADGVGRTSPSLTTGAAAVQSEVLTGRNQSMSEMELEIASLEQVTQRQVTPAFSIDDVDTDREIDFIAHLLDFDTPVLRDQVLTVYRPIEYMIDKPHRIFGLSNPTRTWVDLEEEPETGRYTEIVLTLQMTDQNGPLVDSQINKFSDLAVKIIEKAGGRFQFSMPFDQAKERAVELDEFCKRFDVLAVINVVAKREEVFDGAAIEEFAKDYAMKLGRMKIYHRYNDSVEGGPHLFSLANLYKPGTFEPESMNKFHTNGLTLFMNIPNTHEPGRVFREMAHVGRALRDRFDAQLVDQNKHALTDESIKKIQAEVDRLAAQMQKSGIPAGSERAVRLF